MEWLPRAVRLLLSESYLILFTHIRALMVIPTHTESISSSLRYRSLSEFTTVYGIGPATARMLWDKGCRTIEHLEAYYEVNATDVEIAIHEIKSGRLREPKSLTPGMAIKVGLALRHDFMQTYV